jgi:hypothetical protein
MRLPHDGGVTWLSQHAARAHRYRDGTVCVYSTPVYPAPEACDQHGSERTIG